MFGISLTELLIIIFIALFVVKPKDLPEIAHYAGKIYAKIRRIIKDFKDDLEENKKEIGFDEIKQEFDLAVNEEESKNEEDKKTEIVDIYGNVHKVDKISDIRSDLTREELEEEVKKYNQMNRR